MGLPPRHMINPRPTRFVSGKAIDYRGRPRRYDVDPFSGWREVARVDALIHEVFGTPWGDEYQNSLSRTNLTGSRINLRSNSDINIKLGLYSRSEWYLVQQQRAEYQASKHTSAVVVMLLLCTCVLGILSYEQICSAARDYSLCVRLHSSRMRPAVYCLRLCTYRYSK